MPSQPAPRGRPARSTTQPPADPHRLPARATAEIEGEGILDWVDDDLAAGETAGPEWCRAGCGDAQVTMRGGEPARDQR